jgi:hypothetical protein
MDRVTALAREASTAPDQRRPGMAGALNAMMARLPSEAGSEETAARLQRLLEDGDLDGLVDEEGLQASIAATRTLLSLGYPHALRVPPERLDAMRRWERRTLPVPWLAMAGVLCFAAVFQLGFYTMGYVPPQAWFPFGSMDVPPGFEPAPLVGGLDWFRFKGPILMYSGLLLANGVGWLMTVTVGRWLIVRPWVRRGFAGVAALGLLLGVLQYAAGYPGAGWGAFASAAGALAACWMLRTP